MMSYVKDKNRRKLIPLTPEEDKIVRDHLAWIEKIKGLWKNFESMPYPKEAHIEEQDLELLDTETAGCISSFISNGGKLDSEKIDILHRCIIDLYKFDIYPSQATKDYFQLLIAVSELVLQVSLKMYLYKTVKGFSRRWVSEDNLHIDDGGYYTLHGLFTEFSSYFIEKINDISDEQLKDLFANIETWIINDKNNDNDLANAVCTCFLEYIAAEGLTQTIKPFMGKKSLEYYSHYDYEPMDKKVYEEQQKVCEKYYADYTPVAMDSIAGVSDNTDGKTVPINGLRHPQEGEGSGWFIWSGEEFSEKSDFFKPTHVKHIAEKCPQVLKFLALPPGYRFLIDNEGYVDVWYDPELLKIKVGNK